MVILRESMTVGLKGQIVIPAPFRKAIGIAPGMTVTVGLEEDRVVIEKQGLEIIEKFRALAKRVNLKESIDADKDYDEAMEERWAKLFT